MAALAAAIADVGRTIQQSHRTLKEATTASVMAASVGAFQAIAMVLAGRLLLLLALLGGFYLAVTAMNRQSTISVAVVIAYAVLILFPLVWLEWQRKPAQGIRD